jgi:glutathione S-transferase
MFTFLSLRICPSIAAQKAWIALDLTQAPFELEQVSLYGPNGKPDWFWKLNPKGQVPVLVCHGGAVILADSDLILDEIGNAVKGGSKIVPQDDDSMARVRDFRSTLSEFLPIAKQAVLLDGGGGDNKKKMWDKLKELDALMMVQGPYICGDQVTVADCAGFPFLWRIDTEYGPVEEYGCDNVRAWLDTCKNNKAFSKTIQQSWWWWW